MLRHVTRGWGRGWGRGQEGVTRMGAGGSVLRVTLGRLHVLSAGALRHMVWLGPGVNGPTAILSLTLRVYHPSIHPPRPTRPPPPYHFLYQS